MVRLLEEIELVVFGLLFGVVAVERHCLVFRP